MKERVIVPPTKTFDATIENAPSLFAEMVWLTSYVCEAVSISPLKSFIVDHKTRKSVEYLADMVMEPLNQVPASCVAIQLGDFVDGRYLPFIESKRKLMLLRALRALLRL